MKAQLAIVAAQLSVQTASRRYWKCAHRRGLVPQIRAGVVCLQGYDPHDLEELVNAAEGFVDAYRNLALLLKQRLDVYRHAN